MCVYPIQIAVFGKVILEKNAISVSCRAVSCICDWIRHQDRKVNLNLQVFKVLQVLQVILISCFYYSNVTEQSFTKVCGDNRSNNVKQQLENNNLKFQLQYVWKYLSINRVSWIPWVSSHRALLDPKYFLEGIFVRLKFLLVVMLLV